MRPAFELLFAVLVGLGLEAAMANNYVSEPPLELAAAELGLDGYPAPLDPYLQIKIAELDKPAGPAGANAL